jgi:hypothetical protein
VAILVAIIGVPTLAAETTALGISVSTLAWSIFLPVALLFMFSLIFLQMGGSR